MPIEAAMVNTISRKYLIVALFPETSYKYSLELAVAPLKCYYYISACMYHSNSIVALVLRNLSRKLYFLRALFTRALFLRAYHATFSFQLYFWRASFTRALFLRSSTKLHLLLFLTRACEAQSS